MSIRSLVTTCGGRKGASPTVTHNAMRTAQGRAFNARSTNTPKTLRPRQEAGHRPRGDIDVRPVLVFNAA
jgi:hypothetical protein